MVNQPHVPPEKRKGNKRIHLAKYLFCGFLVFSWMKKTSRIIFYIGQKIREITCFLHLKRSTMVFRKLNLFSHKTSTSIFQRCDFSSKVFWHLNVRLANTKIRSTTLSLLNHLR